MKGGDVEALRRTAAFSPLLEERSLAIDSLHDIDSLSFVAESTVHEDSKRRALSQLELRLDSFSDSALGSISRSCASASVRECSRRLLLRRPR
ncbi:MAG: hypothetical protein U0R44_02640 [Candidatus Micrarchaeia archaeon]